MQWCHRRRWPQPPLESAKSSTVDSELCPLQRMLTKHLHHTLETMLRKTGNGATGDEAKGCAEGRAAMLTWEVAKQTADEVTIHTLGH